MGHAIERIAKARGNEVTKIIDANNMDELKNLTTADGDVAIEFTQPESGYQNIKTCLENGIPIVSGTTGWLDKWDEIVALCNDKKGAFFYASNYSIGVNLFFEINKKVAEVMNGFNDYHVSMEEIHHIHKKDAPSGTAITLAEGFLEKTDNKDNWALYETTKPTDVVITAKRQGEVPGTHSTTYASAVDTIELSHTAHNREGFATGAVIAAEWIVGKTGVLGMQDMLKLS